MFALAVITLSCTNDKCTAYLEGYVKDSLSKQPLDSVYLSLTYGYKGRHIYRSMITDSTGYFNIECELDKKFTYYIEIPTGLTSYDQTYVVDGDLYWKYEAESYTTQIICNTNLPDQIFVSPSCALKIDFMDTSNIECDSIYFKRPVKPHRILKYSCDERFNLDIIYDEIKAGYYYPIEWKLKNDGTIIESHIDSIYCEPFKKNEYSIAY